MKAIRFDSESGDSFYRVAKQRVNDLFSRTGKSRLADRSIGWNPRRAFLTLRIERAMHQRPFFARFEHLEFAPRHHRTEFLISAFAG